VWSQELDLVIPVGPFYLRIFCDCDSKTTGETLFTVESRRNTVCFRNDLTLAMLIFFV